MSPSRPDHDEVPAPTGLDPDLAAHLAGDPSLTRTLRAHHIPALRRLHATGVLRTGDDELRRGGAVEIVERTLPSSDAGVALDALELRPTGRRPSTGLLHLHGGGMVSGDHRSGLGQVAGWVADAGVVLVSLDYRLAPEHPHPTPVEDVHAALCGLAGLTEELGVERWVLCGTSAGGGLAAGAALMARDRGGPDLAGLVLLAPMLDDREETPSSRLSGVPWDAGSNRTGWEALLGDARGGPDVSPYAAPARAVDLRGLPPTFLDVGGVEVFRDETVAFGRRLAADGVQVEMHVWAGAFHGFDALAPDGRLARAARAARLAYVTRLARGEMT